MRRTGLFIALGIGFTPAIIFAGMDMVGFLQTAVTGMCGPYAPDIPAFACSPTEYFTRGSFAGFGRTIAYVLSAMWLTFVLTASLCIRCITKRIRTHST